MLQRLKHDFHLFMITLVGLIASCTLLPYALFRMATGNYLVGLVDMLMIAGQYSFGLDGVAYRRDGKAWLFDGRRILFWSSACLYETRTGCAVLDLSSDGIYLLFSGAYQSLIAVIVDGLRYCLAAFF